MVSHPKTPILNCFYHFLNSVAWPSHILCLALHLCPTFLTSTISPKRVHMKCWMLSWRLESVQFSYKIFCIIHL